MAEFLGMAGLDLSQHGRVFRTSLADKIHPKLAGLSCASVFLFNAGVRRFSRGFDLAGIFIAGRDRRRRHRDFERYRDLFVPEEN